MNFKAIWALRSLSSNGCLIQSDNMKLVTKKGWSWSPFRIAIMPTLAKIWFSQRLSKNYGLQVFCEPGKEVSTVAKHLRAGGVEPREVSNTWNSDHMSMIWSHAYIGWNVFMYVYMYIYNVYIYIYTWVDWTYIHPCVEWTPLVNIWTLVENPSQNVKC